METFVSFVKLTHRPFCLLTGHPNESIISAFACLRETCDGYLVRLGGPGINVQIDKVVSQKKKIIVAGLQNNRFVYVGMQDMQATSHVLAT